jgi:hypothetical protein
MQLILERCTIRPWRLDDAESLAKRANNRKVWLALRDLFPHPYTIQDAHEFLQRAISGRLTTNFCLEVNGVAGGGRGFHGFLLQEFCASPDLCRAVREQSSVGACAREGRFCLRSASKEQRHQRWKASRFTTIREDEVKN